MPKIRVHERALAHLSRGLYRSPASALRELVSNAWDANATRVSIDTNYPTFFQLLIEDNGEGFSKEEFERLMSGGLGNSGKRIQQTNLRFGRPTIGRLGIGMLGIAQICGSFVVTSRPASGKGFRARVRLYDIAKEKMDLPNSELVHDAETTIGDEILPGKIVDVGTYEFEPFDDNGLPRGTRIIADDVIPTFTKAFQDSLKAENYKPIPSDWRSAISRVLNHSISLQLLGDYWRLLWELAAACPVPYVANNALPKSVVKDLNTRLESYNFAVVVDGRRLFKPVLLQKNPGGYTTKNIDRRTVKVYGRPLTYSGYIVVQEGRQLYPDELRGILIRIKNVAIGYYDPSMLDHRVNHGPRSRWLTGEIFVEEGLEDALNVDRDSFNRFHPEFRALQEAVHEILQKEIFPQVYKNLDERSKERRKSISQKRDAAFVQVVKKHEDRPIKLKSSPQLSNSSASHFSSAHRGRDSVEVAVIKADDLPTKKSAQPLARSILAIFELSLLEANKDAQRQKFSELLFDLLRKW